MKKLLNLFVDICLLRATPQDLPASAFLFLLTAVFGLISGTIVIVGSVGALVPALLAQFFDLALLALMLRLGLFLLKKQQRFFQSATALFGSGVLINLITMPLQLLMGSDPADSLIGELGVLFYLVLMIWSLVIIAHILRHSFDIRFGRGLMLAIGYFLLINWLVQGLFQTGA